MEHSRNDKMRKTENRSVAGVGNWQGNGVATAGWQEGQQEGMGMFSV